MPAIFSVGPSRTNTVEYKLSEEGFVIDSRVIDSYYRSGLKFKCTIKGKTLVIRRLDGNEGTPFGIGWPIAVHFRIYDPSIETVPEFNSELYTYHGLEFERAPVDVKEVIVDSSVKVIQDGAFGSCDMMKRCTMGDGVKKIGKNAFCDCTEMKSIRLSEGLRFIARNAFFGCNAIECLFIPSSVQTIRFYAFRGCPGMKILLLPPHIDIEEANEHFGCGSNVLLTADPLLRLCADPGVTAKKIRNFLRSSELGTKPFYQRDTLNGFTPLHILVRYNENASQDAIAACYDANPGALFVPDSEGRTPLDYLWADSKVDLIVHLMQDMCINRRMYDSDDESAPCIDSGIKDIMQTPHHMQEVCINRCGNDSDDENTLCIDSDIQDIRQTPHPMQDVCIDRRINNSDDESAPCIDSETLHLMQDECINRCGKNSDDESTHCIDSDMKNIRQTRMDKLIQSFIVIFITKVLLYLCDLCIDHCKNNLE